MIGAPSTFLCAVLAAGMPGTPSGESVDSRSCFTADLDLAGRLSTEWPDRAIPTTFSLARGRLELGVSRAAAGARLAFVPTRSAGDSGYIGIDGEAFVPKLQVAEARLEYTPWGLGLRAGLVDELWVVTGNQTWNRRPVAPTLSEDQAWFDRSDLGMTGVWTTHESWATVALTGSTGEGPDRRERNDGQNVTAMVVGRPLASLGEPELLEVSLLYRDGSRGTNTAQNHRMAARVSSTGEVHHAGIEYIAAQGVGADAGVEPTGLSVWGSYDPTLPLNAFARADLVQQLPGDSEGNETALWAGAGFDPDVLGPVQLVVAYHQRDRGEQAATVAGADALESERAVYLQLETRILHQQTMQ